MLDSILDDLLGGVVRRRGGKLLRELVDDELACDLSRLGAAHSVGDDQQGAPLAYLVCEQLGKQPFLAGRQLGNQQIVLVVRPYDADVSQTEDRYFDFGDGCLP